MNRAERFGLFLLGNPILIRNNEFCFRDRCYEETLRMTARYVDKAVVVARTRIAVKGGVVCCRLRDSGAELGVAVPDYGIGGLRGIFRVLRILTSSGIRNALEGLIKQAEFIYVEGGTSVESFVLAWLAAQLGRRLILEMRGSTVLDITYMRHRFGVVGILYLALFRLICVYVRRRCAAGLYIHGDLMVRFPVRGKLRQAISDAYLPENFRGVPRSFTTAARSYLYVGHLEKVKRVDLILQSLYIGFADLPTGWCLDIVGSGPEEGRLRSLTAKLGLTQNVNFHGRVEWRDRLSQFYRSADLFLMASTTEGTSRSLIEAMAFGLPVISTRVGNAPEVLDETVLVPVGDTRTYAAMVVGLANNPARLTKFSKRNWELAQAFHQSTLQAQRQEFWKQAIETSRPIR